MTKAMLAKAAVSAIKQAVVLAVIYALFRVLFGPEFNNIWIEVGLLVVMYAAIQFCLQLWNYKRYQK